MRRARLLPRFLALFLSLAIGLPSPAHALRPAQNAQTAGLEELKGRLLEAGNPRSAGLEETPARILAQILGALVSDGRLLEIHGEYVPGLTGGQGMVNLYLKRDPSKPDFGQWFHKTSLNLHEEWDRRLISNHGMGFFLRNGERPELSLLYAPGMEFDLEQFEGMLAELFPSAGLEEEEVPAKFLAYQRELVTEINALGRFRVELDDKGTVSRVTSGSGKTVYHRKDPHFLERMHVIASTPQGLLACEVQHGALYRFANRTHRVITPGWRVSPRVLQQGILSLLETVADAEGVAAFDLRERKSKMDWEAIAMPGTLRLHLQDGRTARVVIGGLQGWTWTLHSAGLEERAFAQLKTQVSYMIRLPNFQEEIKQGGGILRLKQTAVGMPGRENDLLVEGALFRVDPSDAGNRFLILHAQEEVGAEQHPRLGEMAASVFPLSNELGTAVTQLSQARAAWPSDLALFDSTLGIPAELILEEMEKGRRMPNPPRAVLLRPEQVQGLNRRMLNYFAAEGDLPPVIVLLLTDAIQDEAGNTYALAFWA